MRALLANSLPRGNLEVPLRGIRQFDARQARPVTHSKHRESVKKWVEWRKLAGNGRQPVASAGTGMIRSGALPHRASHLVGGVEFLSPLRWLAQLPLLSKAWAGGCVRIVCEGGLPIASRPEMGSARNPVFGRISPNEWLRNYACALAPKSGRLGFFVSHWALLEAGRSSAPLGGPRVLGFSCHNLRRNKGPYWELAGVSSAADVIIWPMTVAALIRSRRLAKGAR